MIDIGFGELFVIGVVALYVLGPKRLPVVARQMGQLWGKLKTQFSHFTDDLSQPSANITHLPSDDPAPRRKKSA